MMTQQRPTFTLADLTRTLSRRIRDAGARERFIVQILAHPQAVRLSQNGPVMRYTTKAVLEIEQEILRDAARLMQSRQHPVSDSVLAFVLRRGAFKTITPEQARAVRHSTGPEGLALIDGQAGTGKTYVMRAIRQIYEAQGYDVIGLAPTNAVARDMRNDGFKKGRTLHSELWALGHGRRQWTSRTIVMVDEAPMIDSRNLARLTRYARAAGAKLILTGDDRQLPSIEAGGMFAVLKRRFGAAQLTEIYRQQKRDDRRAAELMAEGNFQDALASYDRNRDIHWAGTQDEALKALISEWAKDTTARDSQSRFVFAYTNDDVNRLNTELRRVREQRGELGAGHHFDTKHGATEFAAGDRIQFTGTDKPRGIFNGEVGTIKTITGSTVNVILDGRSDQLVIFDAEGFRDFRLGYAGTIYKGQGRTIDQTYLYHSQHWNAAPSYVALTRHREKAALFVARETAADIDELARQVSRVDERRAASHFLHGESAYAATETAASRSGEMPPRRTPNPVKASFREAAKAIVAKNPAEPRPKRRRKKRDEDTRGLFKKLAVKILAPVVRSIFGSDDFNCFTPPDELDETQRLMQREWQSQDAMWQHDNAQAFHYDQPNHLSPHV